MGNTVISEYCIKSACLANDALYYCCKKRAVSPCVTRRLSTPTIGAVLNPKISRSTETRPPNWRSRCQSERRYFHDTRDEDDFESVEVYRRRSANSYLELSPDFDGINHLQEEFLNQPRQRRPAQDTRQEKRATQDRSNVRRPSQESCQIRYQIQDRSQVRRRSQDIIQIHSPPHDSSQVRRSAQGSSQVRRSAQDSGQVRRPARERSEVQFQQERDSAGVPAEYPRVHFQRSRRRLPTIPATARRTPPRSRSYDRDYPMGRMDPVEEYDRKVIIEFCHLLEKSKQLFNGLRELPQYGHKQWQSYFGKTFDVYTKLWKFQQQHRAILDTKYGLKRWQIGEIASKIGQLYYHFYLRTSDTAYLREAFSFYYAIRGRSYYTQACKEDRCELMVKKLRYYARFIVAGLLLKKGKLVRDLLKELDKQIIEYGNTYQPDDQNEWKIVADEVRSFLKVEPVVSVYSPEEYVVTLSHRVSNQVPIIDRTPSMVLKLYEVLIVGSNSTQVKFSELTMDMFRMLQTFEREPSNDIPHMYDESPRQQYASTSDAGPAAREGASSKPDSPHKYMLFKPTPSQIFVYLASACDDLPLNGVVLLYISADGLIVPLPKHPEDVAGGYDVGGLITTSKRDIQQRELKDNKSSNVRDSHVLHPGDLYPFTRRPMVVVVDSDNSTSFLDMPRYFGQPLIILMSPEEMPTILYPNPETSRVQGSLFTLFLHCPLTALCFCCNIERSYRSNWERAQTYVELFLVEAAQILIQTHPDCMYVSFMGDDFLRLLITRFIFCETMMRIHRVFRSRAHRTRCSPPLPDDIFEHPTLTQIIIDLASYLQVRDLFREPAAGPSRE